MDDDQLMDEFNSLNEEIFLDEGGDFADVGVMNTEEPLRRNEEEEEQKEPVEDEEMLLKKQMGLQ